MKKFHFTPKSRLLLIISILSILFFFSLADYI
ncbi:PAP2 family protein, partial [Turicibacter sanguinis]|nr:PAP2 family protein [Turicibacter sanguinis]